MAKKTENKLLKSTKIDPGKIEKLAKKVSNEPDKDKIEKQAKINLSLSKYYHMKLKMYCMINDTNIQETGVKLFKDFLDKQDLSQEMYF